MNIADIPSDFELTNKPSSFESGPVGETDR